MVSKLLRLAVAAVLALSFITPMMSSRAWAADTKGKSDSQPAPKLKVGDTAPNFTLLSFDGHDLKKIQLSDYRGKKNVALAFYVFAFTGG